MSAPLRSPVTYPHVEDDVKGNPVVSGTTMKIVELVMAQQAHGWSPEEIHFQHPELSLGQIHSALAYYWDHQEELDADIEQRSRYVETARREAGPSRLADRIRRQNQAALQAKTDSELAREIPNEALEERLMSSRTGHLRGQLDLPSATSDPWRQQLRERNRRP